MVDTLMQFLTWAIPSGGIGAAIAWIANRKVKAAESAKQVHDTYKSMYEDISRELLTTQRKVDDATKATEDLRDENARTRRALNRLSKAIEAIQICPHRSSCPVSSELRLDEEDADPTDSAPRAKKRQQRKPRQPERDDKPHDEGERPDGDMGECMDDDTAGQQRGEAIRPERDPQKEPKHNGGGYGTASADRYRHGKEDIR